MYYDDLPRGIRIALGGAQVREVASQEHFDAAFLIAHHAMAGVADGVMAHTFSSASIERMTLNGRPIGEIGLESLQLGALGIPVVMVSGDEAGCREAREWLGHIELAPVKKGLATHKAVSLHPKDACDLIREKARRALERLEEFSPLTMDGPFELRVDCFTGQQAVGRAQRRPESQRVGPRSIVRTADSVLDVF
jgi:D-amino peptidase